MPRPCTVLRLAAAFLKYQARAWLGDDFMDAFGNTALGELEACLDAWLRREETARQLLAVVKKADEYFQKRCTDAALRQAFTLGFGDLPAVQAALADLPQALDLDGVTPALEEALRRDLGRALREDQIARGARLYAEALHAAVATLKPFTLPVIRQVAFEIRDRVRHLEAVQAAMARRLDALLDQLARGRPLNREEQALLQEALIQGLLRAQGDVRGSVVIIGSHNTVTLTAAQAQALRPAVTLPGDLPPGSYLPFPRNAAFTGREDALARLAQALLPEEGPARPALVTQAVVGLGGVGKTQLAVEFAYRYGYRFRGVHWLDLRDPDLLEEQIARNGEEMGLKPWPKERSNQVRRTLEAWQQDGPRLLILDNLEDPAAAREALRRLRHHNLRLLLTARRRDWPADLGLALLRLDTFTPEESRAFLRRRLPPEQADDAALDALAERLDHLPLALELAGRYLARQPYLTVTAYLERLQDVFAHRSMQGWRPDLGSPTGHDLDLWAIFLFSWEQVGSPEARCLFLACGFLAPNTIPRAILELVVPDPEALGEAVSDLTGLALREPAEEGPQIHPLLAEFARILAREPQAELDLPAFYRALADLASAPNGEIDRMGNYALFAPLLPHVRAAAEHATPGATDGSPLRETAARLWNSLGYHLHAVADYAATRAAFERALAIDEAAFGPDHPKVAIDLNNLGLVLHALGDLAGAKTCFQRALAILEKQLPPDHSYLRIVRGNLEGLGP